MEEISSEAQREWAVCPHGQMGSSKTKLFLCTLGQQIANYGAGLFCCPREGVVGMLSDQEIQKAADGHFGVLVVDSPSSFHCAFFF